MHKNLTELPTALLNWYDVAARHLPWRVGPADRARGVRPDPYAVWLCEIMMQQTTIPHGTPYFQKFLARWPTVEALAAADDRDVMAAWAGLGYYARARNLLKCAREVSALGRWPQTARDLQKLPGIGPYTAGAIAAMVFDEPVAAVDGNVDRVFARLLALKGEWKIEKKRLAKEVQALVPAHAPGAFAEALMDLGATVCTPKRPNCLICPLSEMCVARNEGQPERYPIKPAKTPKPTRRGIAYVLMDGTRILTERRPEKGLLGGMVGLPTTEWGEGDVVARPPVEADWERVGDVRHVFTHFALELEVQRAQVSMLRPEGEWTQLADVDGLPSVFEKAFRLATQ